MTAAVTALVREHPLLMSGPMVRATLDGRKTQTRRVILPLPPVATIDAVNIGENVWACIGNNGPNRKCPYGQPGDRLWVRETFYIDLNPYDRGPLPKTRPKDLPAWKCSKCGLETGDSADILGPVVGGVRYLVCPVCKATGEFVDANDNIYYRADGECCSQIPECCCGEIGPVPWRPSIHMPRWASRLTLEITEVRVERLQEITPDDAIAEGVTEWGIEQRQAEGRYVFDGRARGLPYLVNAYAELWNSLNAKRGYGWDVNPWVWVIAFKVVTP